MESLLVDDRELPDPEWKLPPESAIHRAARKGNIAELERLLKAGADVNERGDVEIDNGSYLRGLTPLMTAARSIDGATVETLRWLVEHGAEVRAVSDAGVTAAWYGAGHGGRWEFHRKAITPDHAERLRYLLDLGLDPEECCECGRSLLVEACRAGDGARVGLLLSRGARVDARDRARLPSVTDALRGVSSLLPASEENPLAQAPRGGAGEYEIPIFCAARSGAAECVRLLLDAGAGLETRDSGGRTPLMAAGSAAVVRALVEAGADLRARDERGRDAVHALLSHETESEEEVAGRRDAARALFSAGLDVEGVDRRGWTRLREAAFGLYADSVAFLLSVGADAARADGKGVTALHAVCWGRESWDPEENEARERIIRLLVEAGAPVDVADDYGSTPLFYAVGGDHGNVGTARLLLELGADPNAVESDGRTPLMSAAGKGEAECVELLLRAGGDPARRDRDDRDALDAARAWLARAEEWAREDPDGAEARVVEERMRAFSEAMSEALPMLRGFDQEAHRTERAAERVRTRERARRTVELLEGAMKARDG